MALTEVALWLSLWAGPGDTALEAGMKAYRAGDYTGAVQSLSEYAGRSSGNGVDHRTATAALGLSYHFLRDYEHAIPLLERASEWNPSNIELAYALALSYARKRNAAGATAAFARLFQFDAGSAQALMITARFLMREQMDDLAVVLVEKARKLEPNLAQLRYLAGELAIGRNDLDAAVADLKAETVINPGFWMAHYRLGEVYEKKEMRDQAIASLQKAIWLNPDFSSPYILLGRVYHSDRQFDMAEGVLKRAIAMDPNNATARYLLGRVYQSLGKQTEANQQFEAFRALKK